MAYLGGYFLGNQVYSATGTSFSSTGMGITPTFFSYGNGIWIASQQILGTGTGTTYYYTSNPASWSAGYTTGSLSNGQGTMSYVGNPVFIYDRFVITGGNANANYSNQTYMWTSTDGYNWTFVRTKQNPYYSNNPGLYYFQDVINMPNNKYYVHVLGHQNEGSTTSYNASMFWAFSPYFGGGFTGMSSNIQGSATNNYTSNAGFAPGSPGAGSSPSNDFASTWNTSYASTVVSGTYALGFAGSGIASDGFAQGAMFDAYYDWYEDSQGTTVKGLPGSGGRGYSNTSLGSGNLPWQPGANGIVILKWWQ
jgi:hypothetical protein